MILEVFCSGPLDTNCVLLACSKSKKAALIDAPQDCLSLIAPRIKALGLCVEMLLLTHSHQDHIADVFLFKKTWNMPIYVHPLDAPNLQHPGSDLLPIFIPTKGVKPDHLLQNDQLLFLGDLTIKTMHTPGHTPGGVCFYLEKKHLLISGDTLFRGSMGRIDFPQSEPEAMWASLKKLALLPMETKVIPGHGEPTAIKKEAFWMVEAKRRFCDDE